MNNVLLSLLDVAQFRIILFELEKKFLKLFLKNIKKEKCGCENKYSAAETREALKVPFKMN